MNSEFTETGCVSEGENTTGIVGLKYLNEKFQFFFFGNCYGTFPYRKIKLEFTGGGEICLVAVFPPSRLSYFLYRTYFAGFILCVIYPSLKVRSEIDFFYYYFSTPIPYPLVNFAEHFKLKSTTPKILHFDPLIISRKDTRYFGYRELYNKMKQNVSP